MGDFGLRHCEGAGLSMTFYGRFRKSAAPVTVTDAISAIIKPGIENSKSKETRKADVAIGAEVGFSLLFRLNSSGNPINSWVMDAFWISFLVQSSGEGTVAMCTLGYFISSW